MNKAILIGRLGADPETRFSQSNVQVCNFSIATSRKIKGEDQTEWHRIVCFNKTAEIAQKYLVKGSQVCIEGMIQTSEYEKNGEKRYSTNIVCNNLQMLGGTSSQENDSKPSEAKFDPSNVNKTDLSTISDDLPF
jgi:single-strand DNA-binding protein